jgi:hypothetical protein
MATFNSLDTLLKTRFRDANADINPEPYYCTLISEAYDKLVAASPFWPFVETRNCTLTVGPASNSLALPTDVWRVLSMFNLTTRMVMGEIVGRKSFVDMYPDLAGQTGDAYHYRVFNNNVEVYPWPASTITIQLEYALRPPALSAGTDVPLFPSEHHEMLVEYGLWKAYEDDGHFTEAQLHQKNWDDQLATLVRELTEPRGDSYAQISDTWY